MGAFTHYVLKPLSLIGALNWGLVGFFKFDLVAWLFGPMTMLSRLVYAVIGVAALIWLFIWIFSDKPMCECHHSRRDQTLLLILPPLGESARRARGVKKTVYLGTPPPSLRDTPSKGGILNSPLGGSTPKAGGRLNHINIMFYPNQHIIHITFNINIINS